MICCAHGLSFYLLLEELQTHSWENIFTGLEENEHATGWQALAFSQYFFLSTHSVCFTVPLILLIKR